MPTEYEPTPHPTLRQGDIVLAPTAILQRPLDETSKAVAPAVLGAVATGLLWSRSDDGLVPGVAVEGRWAPVLVLSHDCGLEKEFNERVEELLAAGVSEDDAVAEASVDPTLDPYAVVAPLLAYSEFEPSRHAGIRAGQRIGVLPVDALPGDGGDYVVDLFRPATLSVELLPQAAKVASLAPTSVHELRYKLSEAYASRDLAVLAELEALVGHTIIGVEALPKTSKKTALILHLQDAESIHLEIRSPREALPAEITRTPRSTPAP